MTPVTRKEFLKFSGATFLAAVFGTTPDRFAFAAPETLGYIKKEDLTNNNEFDLYSTPWNSLISYAFSAMEAVNSFKPSNPALSNSLQATEFATWVNNKISQDYGLVGDGKSLNDALCDAVLSYQPTSPIQDRTWQQILSSLHQERFGVPRPLTNEQFTLPSKVRAETGQKLIKFHEVAKITDLYPGDTVISKYTDLDGISKPLITTVLARSNEKTTGDPIILVTHADRKIIKGQVNHDGKVRIGWLNQSLFEAEVVPGKYPEMVVLRSKSMDTLITEGENARQEYLKLSEKELINLSTCQAVIRTLYGCMEQARFLGLDRASRADLIANTLAKAEITTMNRNQAFLDSWKAMISSDNYWRQFAGQSEEMLIQLIIRYTTWGGYGQITHSIRDLENLGTNLLSTSLVAPITSPMDRLTELKKSSFFNKQKLFTPTTTQELALGDTVFVPTISNSHLDQTGSVISVDEHWWYGTVASIFFPSWMGTGMAKVYKLQGPKANIVLTDDNIKEKVDFVIFRNRCIDDVKEIEDVKQEYLLSFDQLPQEIQQGKAWINEDYRNIPVFKALQNQLARAQTLKQRGHTVMQILANLGVETKDGSQNSEKNQFGTGKPANKCNLFSTKAMQAILGNPDLISHWVDHGKPTMNYGDQLNASAMGDWMRTYGPTYGWFPVMDLTEEQRLELLKTHILYGSEYIFGDEGWNGIGDTWIIYGIEGKNGNVIPVETRASHNTMAEYPRDPYHFTDPKSFFEDRSITKDILWAHTLPGV